MECSGHREQIEQKFRVRKHCAVCEKTEKFKAGVVRGEPRDVRRAQGIKEGSHRVSRREATGRV